MMYFWGRSKDKTYMSKTSSKVRFKYEIQIEKPPKVKICKKKRKLLSPPKFYLPFRIWDPLLVMRRYQSKKVLKVNFKLSKNLNSVP